MATGDPANVGGGLPSQEVRGSQPRGRGRAKGRGIGEGAPSDGGGGAEPRVGAPGGGGGGGSGEATRALVKALRSFASPQWWLIADGKAKGSEEVRVRRRVRPDVFRRQCGEKHAEMAKVYESAMMQDSEQRWLRKVSAEGTSGDRVASLTMLVQVCPVFSTKYIKALLGMSSKMARGDSMMALDALKDLFIGTLLPDRKLRTLSQMQPVAPKGISEVAFVELCVVSYFEDFLKTAFAAYVQVISEAAHNTVIFFKTKAVRTACDLLAAKPEQERALLGLLVNKFGDLAPKVSSNVSFSLKKLVEVHPGMKIIIVKEVETFLARPNINHKSKYFAVLHLSEMILSRNDGALAAQLVKVFVAQLEAALNPPAPSKKMLLKRKRRWKAAARKSMSGGLREEDNRSIRTLINGIQRMLPYLDSTVAGSPVEADTVEALFRVCHTVSAFSMRVAILSLLFRTLISSGELPDRFYRLLYEQVMQFDIFGSAHKMQAFVLLRKSVPVDVSVSRGVAVARRLLQVGANAEPSVAVVGLAVLRELFTAHRAEMKPLLRNVDSGLGVVCEDDGAEEERFVDDDAAPGGGGAAAALVGTAAEKRERYLPLAREPRFARARRTPLWELYALASHVHPFVAHGANRMIAAEHFQDASEDPFQAFACSALLDQFAYASRAPRTKKGQKGAERVPYNSPKFSNRKSVAPHERFFQLYFRDAVVQQQQKQKASGRRKKLEDVDEEESQAEGKDDDADKKDRFLDEYLEEQMPKGDYGDSDIDIDDDCEEEEKDDFGSDGSSGDFDGSGDGLSAGGVALDDDDGGGSSASADDEEGADASGRTKRSAGEAGLKQSGQERMKAIRRKHEGSLFASADDFEKLLQDDMF